jgi:hypothetical protein
MRAQKDRRLKVLVHTSFAGGRGYYGSPRIYDDFVEWQERLAEMPSAAREGMSQ